MSYWGSKRAMKILFLAQRVPYPPNKGDKLRSFHQIKYLSQNHDIDLVCLSDNEKDLKSSQGLQAYCRTVDVISLPKFKSNLQSGIALLTGTPLTLAYFHSRQLQAVVNRKLHEESYDVIFVFCSSMAQYVERRTETPRVIDFVDVDSEKWLQYATYAKFPMNWLYRLECRRLRKYEAKIAMAFQHSFFVSAKETEDFRQLVCHCETITPILNGVDLDAFSPSKAPYDPKKLVFTGAMDYFANVEAVLYFVREILPHIQKRIVDVKFYVVGSNPTKEITELPKSHPNVIVTGFVEAVQPFVQESAVLVAPMRIARGVQNKILEGMSMGVPVVTTSLGFEGITATPGKDLFVEDDPQRFANQVLELMQNADLRKHASDRSRETVKLNYSWSANLEKLERILEAMSRVLSA